jgi:pimeloyl-ACP methyl ester carboxylesterase
VKVLVRITGALILLALAAAGAFYWNPLGVNDQQIRYHLWRANVRSEYVDVSGNRIHYFEAIPPDGSPGKPLLLLHGLGSRGEDWSPLIPSLAAAGFHVYAPDLLGYGRSDKPGGPYSIKREERVVTDFIWATHLAPQDAVTGGSHIDIAGWSMGGWIAAKLALDNPAWFDRLVLYDSAGVTFPPAFPGDAFVPTDAAGLQRLMILLSPRPRTLPPFVVRATLRKFARSGKIIQQSMDSMEHGDDLLDTRLSAIKQPTLIMWGTEDKLIPMAIGEAMHRDIPHSVFEGIIGCGHLAPAECPKPVLAGTIQFLKAEPPMQGGEQMLPATAQASAKPESKASR